jgi:membrane fusion protein, heavy metal efflux system
MSSQTTEERRAEAAANRVTTPVGTPQRKQWIVFGALALVAAVILFFVFSRRGKQEEAAAPPAANPTGTVAFLMEQQWLIKMKLAQAEKQSLARQITATGRVIPAANHQAIVAPPVGGIIQRGNIPRVGQRVAPGQLIATLQQTATSAEQSQVRAAAAAAQSQNTQLALEAARFEAERRTATGDAESARARLDLARKEAERARRLYEQKAYSQRQVETAEAELRTAQAASDAAQARLKVLEAVRAVPPVNTNVGSANATYAVRAPIGGFVTKVSKNIGEQVAPGEAILEITNLDTVWVEAPLFERDLSLVTGNGRASFTTAAYPDREFRGALINLGEVIDEQTRSASVIFAIPNPGRALRVGMQANVRLDAGASVEAMVIPKEAILEHEGKKIVYVLLSGEEFERREITPGDEYGDKVAVLAGLKAGERVVTQGAYQLKLQELRPADAGAHSHET